jgi:hypothetical protein
VCGFHERFVVPHRHEHARLGILPGDDGDIAIVGDTVELGGQVFAGFGKGNDAHGVFLKIMEIKQRKTRLLNL